MKVLLLSNMYPSAQHPSFGVFVRNHVERMQRDHGVEFELVVSDRKTRGRRDKVLKYADLTRRSAQASFADFDLIHLHYVSPINLVTALPPWLFSRRPLVLTSHGGDIQSPVPRGPARRFVSEILGRAAAVIAVSRGLAEELIALGAPPERLSVIDMGCDATLFSPALGEAKRARKAALGVPLDLPLILFAGALIPRKGLDVLLDALRGFPHPVRVAVIGEGPERSLLETHPAAVQLGHRLHVLGALPQVALADWYAAADVFVFPTRREPFGLVTLEAMASGTPVVASAVGGVLELITHDENGLLFEAARSDALATQLLRVFDEPGLGERLVSAGMATVADHTLDRQVARVLGVYRAAAQARVTAKIT